MNRTWKITEQEIEFQEYLREGNIPFMKEKTWVGHGGKKWRTDFYLHKHHLVVECKDHSKYKIDNEKAVFQILERSYKDAFKLDELGELYNLKKVLYLKTRKRSCIPLSFITNLTSHGIFMITNQIQILPILQGLEILENNNEIYHAEKLKVNFLMDEKEEKKLELHDSEKLLLLKWVNGETTKELGLHAMQMNRLLRKFVKKELGKYE